MNLKADEEQVAGQCPGHRSRSKSSSFKAVFGNQEENDDDQLDHPCSDPKCQFQGCVSKE